MVTVAPDTTAPVGSVTVPDIVPVIPCAVRRIPARSINPNIRVQARLRLRAPVTRCPTASDFQEFMYCLQALDSGDFRFHVRKKGIPEESCSEYRCHMGASQRI